MTNWLLLAILVAIVVFGVLLLGAASSIISFLGTIVDNQVEQRFRQIADDDDDELA